MPSLVMSENGRILIPSALREQLGFKPNSRIFLEVKDGALVLTPAAKHSKSVRAYFDHHLPIKGVSGSVDEFIADRREQAEREGRE